MIEKKVSRISLFAEDDSDIEYDYQVVFDDNIKVEYGDVFILGNHRLMCGDATKRADVQKLVGGGLGNMWITDPPYNVDYEGATEDKLRIMNDNMGDEQFREFLKSSYQNVVDVLKDGSSYYIFHADSEGYNFRGALRDVGLTLRQTLIWKKNALIMGRQDYHWIHEPILYGWKDGAAHNWYSDRRQTTILEFVKPLKSELHPTMKPLDLLIYLIQNSSKKGDTIIDTFAGSGSTLLAAEMTQRKSFNMELDPFYVNVIIKRFERMTGKKHKKVVD